MLGMIVRADLTGLGFQTKRLCRLLKPDRLMLIDSTPFNGNKQYDWYQGYPKVHVTGFPTDMQISGFLRDLKTVVTAESFYSNRFVDIARDQGVKTVQIFNYEFWDNLRNPFLAQANVLIQPSLWKLEEMKKYGAIYLPTPIFDDEFEDVRKENMNRLGFKYLFINGKTAAMDRNGLESLYEALHHSKGNFTVTVKAQNDVKKHPDPRLIYDFTNPEDQAEMYRGYDALLMPRRYGGQSLPMCEALSCGIPVIMTDIEPNNLVLPKEWLVKAEKTDELMTRTIIDVYTADPHNFAYRLDNLKLGTKVKKQAYELSKQYEAESLREKYEAIL